MDIPPRTATSSYLARMGRQLDVVFDVDLGELTQGRHVVARGVMYGQRVREIEIDLHERRLT